MGHYRVSESTEGTGDEGFYGWKGNQLGEGQGKKGRRVLVMVWE